MSIKSSYQRQRLLWIAVIVIAVIVILFMRNAAHTVPSITGNSGAPPSVDATLKALPKEGAPLQLPIQHWTTAQGVRVYFIKAPEIPMLDIRILWDAGAARDGHNPGLSQLTNAVMADGTQQRDADQLATAFADIGAVFGSSSGRDLAMLSLRTLTDTDKQKQALALLTDVLAHPAFRASSITRIVNQTKADIIYNKKQPGARTKAAFYQALYGQHPYGHAPEGSLKSVSSISSDQLRAFYKQYYSTGSAVLAIVGDVTLERAKAIAQRISSALPVGRKPAALPASPQSQAHTTHISLPITQTSIVIGVQGIARNSPDYAALYVANHILGGSGLTSLLMTEVREKRGLTYGVSSDIAAMREPGPFVITLKTRNDKAQEALDVVKKTLQQFINQGPTPAQLQQAKRSIIRSYPLGLASNAALAGQLGAIGFYSLPTDTLQQFLKQIENLTAEQIKETFARYVHMNQLIVITAGPHALVQSDNGS